MDLEKLWNEKLEGRAWQVKEEFLSLLSYMQDHNIKNVLEIGTHKGGAALGFLSIGCNVVSVDIVKQPEIKEFETNYSNFIYLDRAKALDYMTQEHDMLFIDGDHSYEDCKKDYQEFSPYVKDKKLIVFHDIVNSELHKQQECEVWKFWKEIKDNNSIEIIADGNWGGIGIAIK